MDREFDKVKDFHVAFRCPIAEKPVMLTLNRAEIRSEWMQSEIQEFIDSQSVYEQADAMIDLIYFALGTLVEMGVKPDKIFDIVHEANMSKLFVDGSIGSREGDGKIIKPPEWQDPEPEIREAIDNMSNMG